MSSKSTSASTKPQDKRPDNNKPGQQPPTNIPQLGALEEDDEFEEFAAEDWNETEEDKETHLWEDNWDDEDVEDEFSKQLRAELTKTQIQPQPMKM
ncbi:9060_t:CDS:2 [Paraglomus occultum]|uniref:26S proteasome complex subunit SEM1 n=1 Tax=Paraglomus occultum TaxID=144539 RepID=A0A9N9F697_9GLOM|nr:9060_t:CDS:2 [Paraglomus occultum]